MNWPKEGRWRRYSENKELLDAYCKSIQELQEIMNRTEMENNELRELLDMKRRLIVLPKAN